MKHVKLFEAFVASQKLNEGWNGPIIDGFEELLDTGIGVEKAYDQMKKSGVLKGLETEFNASCQDCGHTWKTGVDLDIANFFGG